jgi:protein XagA
VADRIVGPTEAPSRAGETHGPSDRRDDAKFFVANPWKRLAHVLIKALPRVAGTVPYNNPNRGRPFPLRLERSVRVLPVSQRALILAAAVCFLERVRGAFAAGVVLALLAPAAALAGAWTYPTGQGQIIETLFGWAGEGPPYGGAAGQSESRVEAQTYVEYGLGDRLTVVGQTALERYELTGPPADVYRGLDYSSIGLRANLWSNDAVVISAQATAFVPGAHDSSRPAQAGDTGGAGEARALVGYNFSFFSTPAFLDAEAAYRLRCAGPPNEWHFDVTLGLEPNARVMWLLQSYNTISPWSSSPIFPAWSSYAVQLSIVYALDEHWSVQAGAFTTVATVETNSQRGLLAAIWRKF